MSGEQYADRAVSALVSYIESNYTTALRAIETAEGLTSGTIDNPLDYVPAHVPDDTRSPLVQVWCSGGTRIPDDDGGSRNAIFGYACTVAVTYASDADVETGQKRIRQYGSAILNTLEGSRTLGSASGIIHAIDTTQNYEATHPDATTRYAVEIGVEVIVNEA